MAEHSAVNRRVVGSSPTCGAKVLTWEDLRSSLLFYVLRLSSEEIMRKFKGPIFDCIPGCLESLRASPRPKLLELLIPWKNEPKCQKNGDYQ